MRRADIVTDIEVIGALGTTFRNTILRGIQRYLERYATIKPWPHYRTRGTIQTYAPYETGTVNVTNSSKNLTFAGSTLTNDMVNRKIRFGSDSAWYDIASVNTGAGTAVMAQEYQGTTNTVATFSIFQDEYLIAGDAYRLLNMRQTENGVLQVGMTYLDFDELDPNPDSTGEAEYYTILGREDTRYTTGTIAATANSKTLTGTSTEWLSVPGLGRGSRLAIEDTGEVFTVRTVNSDTSITTYEAAVAADASSTYIIYQNNIKVQVGPLPSAQRNLYYRYHRLPYHMVNDYDEPDMPKEHHYALVWAGLSIGHALNGKREDSVYAEGMFMKMIEEQWAQLASTMPDTWAVKETVDRWPQQLGGRYPDNYGVPWIYR